MPSGGTVIDITADRHAELAGGSRTTEHARLPFGITFTMRLSRFAMATTPRRRTRSRAGRRSGRCESRGIRAARRRRRTRISLGSAPGTPRWASRRPRSLRFPCPGFPQAPFPGDRPFDFRVYAPVIPQRPRPCPGRRSRSGVPPRPIPPSANDAGNRAISGPIAPQHVPGFTGMTVHVCPV